MINNASFANDNGLASLSKKAELLDILAEIIAHDILAKRERDDEGGA